MQPQIRQRARRAAGQGVAQDPVGSGRAQPGLPGERDRQKGGGDARRQKLRLDLGNGDADRQRNARARGQGTLERVAMDVDKTWKNIEPGIVDGQAGRVSLCDENAAGRAQAGAQGKISHHGSNTNCMRVEG